MTDSQATVLAAALDLDVSRIPICYPCLSFVAFARDDADARREARRVTPDIWDEGLKEAALAALRHAADTCVRDAAAALADASGRGGRSPVARAIVLCLAAQLAERSRSPVDAEATAGWAGTGWTVF